MSLTLSARHRQLLRQAATRHGRRKSDCFLCEGLRGCREALRYRPDWLEVAVFSASLAASGQADEMRRRIPPDRLAIVPDEDFAGLAVTEAPQGALLLLRRRPPSPGAAAPRDPLALVLDRIGDPGNLGTILRTAWAIGLHRVWLTTGTADPFSPKAIRAGMGAQFALEFEPAGSLAEARERLAKAGYARLWLSSPRDGVSCYDAAFRLDGAALVIGGEAEGVGELPGAPRVTIPMPGGAESLNAAQAATLLLFEAVRRGVLGTPVPAPPPEPAPRPRV
ncbi:MAG: 23S rRNA (uridine(2479)-2'-O)-methyltransferase [Lentisphaerae bacterium ADurb.BinA184]|nr:MAG: 23S rRNA (uridine(2479)-2'-O)-methyltransferase [Lentisphaerae bacterium ADurb.BinA184]